MNLQVWKSMHSAIIIFLETFPHSIHYLFFSFSEILFVLFLSFLQVLLLCVHMTFLYFFSPFYLGDFLNFQPIDLIFGLLY